jgi:hypothetical protein
LVAAVPWHTERAGIRIRRAGVRRSELINAASLHRGWPPPPALSPLAGWLRVVIDTNFVLGSAGGRFAINVIGSFGYGVRATTAAAAKPLSFRLSVD